MRRREVVMLAIIAVLALVAGWIAWPENPGIHTSIGSNDVDIDFRIVEGLDLQGGLQVLLEANPPPGTPVNRDAMEAARSIIEERVNAFGTTEPVIQIQGNSRIVVELPGIKSQEDRERAIQLFGETGLLEFVDAGNNPLSQGQKVDTVPDCPNGQSPEPGKLCTILTGAHLAPREVAVSFDQRNRPQINFGWDSEGAKTFGDYTASHINQFLCIVLDKVVLSCPRINSRIDDRGVIQGSFSLQEAKDIVTKLKYGALPVPMQVIQQREVGATLGQDSVRKSIVAGAVGLGIVMAFMLIYYRLPGLLADGALLIYSMITFAIFKNPWQPVTLTLAGIAGFILSIGMAVDANILIFERTKEELRSGRTLGSAIETGFERAFTSIRDSNFSTLMTCAILYYFGTSTIRGFALTLAVGVLVSMFTAIVVTHTFLRTLIGMGVVKHPWLFGVSSVSSGREAPPRPARLAQPAGA
jgi:protein-export membrane protein SecD